MREENESFGLLLNFRGIRERSSRVSFWPYLALKTYQGTSEAKPK